MHRAVPLALALCALSSLAAAQTALLPANLGPGYEGSSSTGTLFSATGTGVRQQMIYSALPQGRLTITRLRFRHNGGSTITAGGTWTNATIDMCTSANPVASVSSTFANNLGTDLVNVYSGPIAVAPTVVAYPGQYYVDVTLTTPFVYNSTGGDLLIDVTLPNGGWTGATTTTDYHIPTGTPAARVYSTNPANATGTVNTGAGIVCLIDYTVDPQSATSGRFGSGCYDSTFYEFWSAASNFDLSNTALRMQPNSMGGYDVTSIPVNYVTPTSPALAMTSGSLDDGLALCTLPFAFPFTSGSTTSVKMCTNGFVWLDPAQTLTSFGPTAALLLGSAPRLAVAWTDWNANPTSTSGGGSLHFDVDPSNLFATLTWNGVAAFGWTSTYGGPVFSTFQCKIFADGSIEYHYLTVTNPYPVRDMLVGLQPDATVRPDTGSIDISATNPIVTVGGTAVGLRLSVSSAPVLGTTPTFDVANIPAAAVLTGVLLSYQTVPGIELSSLGMPGCRQYVNVANSVVLGIVLAGPTASLPLPVPNNPIFVGAFLHGQAVSFVPGSNTFGAISSNGADFRVGAF